MEMESIMAQYLSKKKTYERFKVSLINLMHSVIEEHSQTSMHLIVGRVKEEDSLRKKIIQKGEKYNDISEITDIVGIRIISYLESEVDKIGRIIEKEFEIDRENSVDKRKHPENEFGYSSLHYVVNMTNDRCNQTEYKQFKSIKFEIQVRSILQHTWAEIEHDLKYKSPIGVPQELIRNFSRLAAILETADVEFDRLKKALTDYKEQVPERIKSMPNNVEINVLSLESLYETNEILKEAQNIINKYVTKNEETSSNVYDIIINAYNYLGLNSIGQLEFKLNVEKERFLYFVDRLVKLNKDRYETNLISRIELLYFAHYLSAKEENESSFIEYMKMTGLTIKKDPNETAQKYINIYSSYSLKFGLNKTSRL